MKKSSTHLVIKEMQIKMTVVKVISPLSEWPPSRIKQHMLAWMWGERFNYSTGGNAN
jgi:hypothetical protein